MHEVSKPIKERSVQEIESKLQGMGDYVQMSYLQRALKSGLDFETRKHVLIRLAKIYEVRGMYSDAARTIRAAAEINTTYAGKIRDFMKAVELYIKGGNYDESDTVFSQSLVLGNELEKAEMKRNRKQFYMTQGKVLLSADKRNHARRNFERMLNLDLDISEKKLVQDILLELYQKLGLIREYYILKESM